MSALDELLLKETPRQRLLWLGLLGLVVLWFFALVFRGTDIEQDIAERVSGRLDAAGFERVVVEISGRDVELRGQVSGQASIGRALELARGVEGVRLVRDATRKAVVSLPWLRMVRSDDGTWDIRGVLATESDWEGLTSELQQRTPDRFRLEPQTDPERGDAEWIGGIGQLLQRLIELEQGRLEVGAGFIEAGGMVADIGGHAVLLEELEKFADSAQLTLVNRIALRP